MNWKEFLKHDGMKIGLTVLIGISFNVLFFASYLLELQLLQDFFNLWNKTDIHIPLEMGIVFEVGIINIILLALLGIIFYKYKMGKPRNILGAIIVIFLFSTYLYLLSCLIVWIYDKVKK